MKARLLKQYLNTERTVHETDNGIHVGSGYISELITVNKENLHMTYAFDHLNCGRDSLNNDELVEIWDKLAALIESGEIQFYIEGSDVLDNELPVFYHDHRQVIETTTDEYGWPNVTASGLLMYENTFWKTREEAKQELKEDALSWQAHLRERIEKNVCENRKLSNELHELDGVLASIATSVATEGD